ncbi:uncharacterized protein A1O9_04948 [Exophiala aquamarina CBS 119918]|uniref:SPT2 chromatin protein n=1 Tax=Exophiala aquamarina CBS 119918 TaxID=1182545 RepID=A0A072PL70_9EURO|nr:uncharacterized protein A1O9_04948 [Exophiala aquamarina CBS 119918]KEF60098.1 hypothetical protein A1O9_04948 [Exophiala aquamarina CBS 119918]
MSFLGDIVNSIGSGKAPTPPKPLARPTGANPQRQTPDVSRPGIRPGFPAIPSPLNGTKRKADDDSVKVPEKHTRPNPSPGLTGTVNRRTTAPPLNAPKPLADKVAPAPKPKIDTIITMSKAGTTPPVTPTTLNAKLPAKGSYADIMARAKQAQEAKSQNQVGMIKHQATNREKTSKLAERKKQEEEKARAAKEKPTIRSAKSARTEKGRSVSPAKKSDQPRAPKVARPPLHAPSTGYKGTMGKSASKPRLPPGLKKNRYDEYLGTDEEEDSEAESEDEGDYDSEASSDMEAGAFDIDEEERFATRAAKVDDAREQAEEQRLKREKEERRRRLMSLAGKRK